MNGVDSRPLPVHGEQRLGSEACATTPVGFVHLAIDGAGVDLLGRTVVELGEAGLVLEIRLPRSK